MASISLASAQKYAEFCNFRHYKLISIETNVLCSTNYTPVLFVSPCAV
jgi:hypothetical protein